jgi:hypothetical protein
MPEMIGMLIRLKPNETIEGSSQLARAVWALGRLGKPSSPADIARTIRECTVINWEGTQAGKFFRQVFETRRHASWFIRTGSEKGGPHGPRYLYDLTDHARAYFKKNWTTGDWRPDLIVGKLKETTERVFREKNHTPEGKDRIIEKLEHQVKLLTEQNLTMFNLLNRIHTCHHGEVEATMSDIDAYLAGAKEK